MWATPKTESTASDIRRSFVQSGAMQTFLRYGHGARDLRKRAEFVHYCSDTRKGERYSPRNRTLFAAARLKRDT